MTPQPRGQGGNDSLVRCEIDGQPYAFDSTDVRLIVRSDRISPAIDRADGRIGVVQGPEVIPVYSLTALLGLRGEPGHGEHVIVTAAGDRLAAWRVDRVIRGSRDAASQRLALPELAGPVTRRWFKALLGDEVGSLICSPAGMDPRVQAWSGRGEVPLPSNVWSNPAAVTGAVALFSSPALPACGASRHAVSARRVLAVAHALAVRTVPGTPPHVVGLASWMGFAVPVLDFSGRRGVTAGTGGRFLILSCDAGPKRWPIAVAIDRDVVLHRATPGDRCVRQAGPDVPDALQLFSVKGERVALLDVDVLVAGAVADTVVDRREPPARTPCTGASQPVA
jgi:chemotaxis signal transduction protein